MRPLPTNHLDPRMRTVWRATTALRILIVLLCVLVGIVFPIYAVGGGSLPLALVVALVVLFGIDLVVQAFIVPGMRYDRWLFEVAKTSWTFPKASFGASAPSFPSCACRTPTPSKVPSCAGWVWHPSPWRRRLAPTPFPVWI